MAPFLGVALIPLLIGAPLAVPALLLAGGGWLGWRAWLIVVDRLNPAQQEQAQRIAEGVEFQWLPAGAWQGRRTRLLAEEEEEAYLPSTISGDSPDTTMGTSAAFPPPPEPFAQLDWAMYDVLMVEQDALFGEQPPTDGFQAQVLSRWRSIAAQLAIEQTQDGAVPVWELDTNWIPEMCAHALTTSQIQLQIESDTADGNEVAADANFRRLLEEHQAWTASHPGSPISNPQLERQSASRFPEIRPSADDWQHPALESPDMGQEYSYTGDSPQGMAALPRPQHYPQQQQHQHFPQQQQQHQEQLPYIQQQGYTHPGYQFSGPFEHEYQYQPHAPHPTFSHTYVPEYGETYPTSGSYMQYQGRPADPYAPQEYGIDGMLDPRNAHWHGHDAANHPPMTDENGHPYLPEEAGYPLDQADLHRTFSDDARSVEGLNPLASHAERSRSGASSVGPMSPGQTRRTSMDPLTPPSLRRGLSIRTRAPPSPMGQEQPFNPHAAAAEAAADYAAALGRQNGCTSPGTAAVQSDREQALATHVHPIGYPAGAAHNANAISHGGFRSPFAYVQPQHQPADSCPAKADAPSALPQHEPHALNSDTSLPSEGHTNFFHGRQLLDDHTAMPEEAPAEESRGRQPLDSNRAIHEEPADGLRGRQLLSHDRALSFSQPAEGFHGGQQPNEASVIPAGAPHVEAEAAPLQRQLSEPTGAFRYHNHPQEARSTSFDIPRSPVLSTIPPAQLALDNDRGWDWPLNPTEYLSRAPSIAYRSPAGSIHGSISPRPSSPLLESAVTSQGAQSAAHRSPAGLHHGSISPQPSAPLPAATPSGSAHADIPPGPSPQPPAPPSSGRAAYASLEAMLLHGSDNGGASNSDEGTHSRVLDNPVYEALPPAIAPWGQPSSDLADGEDDLPAPIHAEGFWQPTPPEAAAYWEEEGDGGSQFEPHGLQESHTYGDAYADENFAPEGLQKSHTYRDAHPVEVSNAWQVGGTEQDPPPAPVLGLRAGSLDETAPALDSIKHHPSHSHMDGAASGKISPAATTSSSVKAVAGLEDHPQQQPHLSSAGPAGFNELAEIGFDQEASAEHAMAELHPAEPSASSHRQSLTATNSSPSTTLPPPPRERVKRKSMEGLNLQTGIHDGDAHGKEAKLAADQGPHPHSGPTAQFPAPYRSPFEAHSVLTESSLEAVTDEPLATLTEKSLERLSSPTKGKHRKAAPSNASLGSTLAVMGSNALPEDVGGLSRAPSDAHHSSTPPPFRGSGPLFTPISSRDPHRPQPVPIPPELDTGLQPRASFAASPFQSRSLDEDVRYSKVDQFVDALEAGATPLMGLSPPPPAPLPPHPATIPSQSLPVSSSHSSLGSARGRRLAPCFPAPLALLQSLHASGNKHKDSVQPFLLTKQLPEDPAMPKWKLTRAPHVLDCHLLMEISLGMNATATCSPAGSRGLSSLRHRVPWASFTSWEVFLITPRCFSYCMQESTKVSGESGDYDDLLVRFRRADLDGNGVIDKDELKLLLETVEDGFACPTTQWIQDNEVEEVMNLYDKTGSGDITFDEFKALANDGVLLKGKLGEYADAFSAVDKDGNGSIEMSELGDLFEALEHPMEQQELMKVMDQYDENHQGQIDFGDFLRMFRHKLLDLQDLMKYMSMKSAREQEQQQQQQQAAAPSKAEQPAEEKERVVIVNSEEELDEKLKADATKLLVLLSTVTWCRPCKTLKRPLEKLAEAYSNVSFATLYGNANEDLKHVFRDRLGTKVTPTFFFYRNGEIVHTHTGANKTKLETFIRENSSSEEEASLPQELYPA
ncbi:hypothetical protein WJX74_001948 [Apatococcus lobatus]|uniref:Uncharacterized protein n=1 Tax=Apatococcus lobatus TaxID=904363 RepID=A0AAW1S9J9_9CHLO